MQMENINSFLTAAKQLGVPQADMFMTVDLYEEKNMNQVLQTLVSLGRCAQKLPGYHGPLFGARLADKNARQFNDDQLKAGKTEVPLLTAGAAKGASQAGMRSIGRNIVKVSHDDVLYTSSTPSQQTSGHLGATQAGMTPYGKQRDITGQQ